ncbi:probable GABA transporter 2 isoform X2 [Oryza glaberrima]|uniref:Amino acid transporter transmembrane domain-containing protein n=1 Tax=Oryza glaberrima TaxID=4538 RepID=I1PYE2_ORYGL|nr:probable GABA transporter 2 isoform X2 [Oryza glaberrima]
MAGTGGSPLLRSPSPVMNTMPTPPSAAVFDVEAASGARRLGIKPAADAGAAFVLESKGKWWHAGFHLTTAIVGPTVLTLPYALRGMGWALGLVALTAVAAVTFYAYYLMSRVLDHCEAHGRRHIRFRELAADVLGSGWVFYLVVTVQTAINAGITIGSILLAADCLQIMYSDLAPNGPLTLYHFIIVVAVVLSLLSQLPSFHSLRYINLGSLLLSFGYTILVSAACIRAGALSDVPEKDYSLSSSNSEKTFNAFLSISILASVFGNGILPEIQATLAPPAAGKMMKALVLCYTVVLFTFYLPAITGYWAFGSQVQSNVLQSLMPDKGPSLAPTWLLGLAVVLVLLQLLAIALVYSQVAYEIMEKSSADAARGRFSRRNVAPRVALRTAYVAACAFVAAMLPFFGDIVGVVGAVGFIPLDFVLPVVMYNMALAPPRRSPVYLANVAIMVVFTGVGLIGAVASVRKLVLDAGQFKLFSGNVVD